MDLFRVNRSDGIDNYTQYVKPRLDAERSYQKTKRAIRGLQSTTRRQGSAIRNLGRQSQALQGNSVPQYYQNYGNYYPGLGR